MAEGLPEPTGPDGGPLHPSSDPVASFDADVARRNARDEELERRATRAEAALDAMVQRQPQAPPPQAPPPLGAPPDPVSNPEGHRQWVMEAHRRTAAETAAARQDALQSRLDALWYEFKTTYPDAAEDEDLVAAAFSRETQKTGGQIPSDIRGAMARMAADIRGRMAKIKDAAGRTTPGRTDGVLSGESSRPAPKKAEAPKPMTFVDQIKKQQEKLPYF